LAQILWPTRPTNATLSVTISSVYNAFTGVSSQIIELGLSPAVATPVAQLSTQTVGEVVTGIGTAKLAFDASTFLYGYYFACKPK
jgi:hypothetical protein